MNNQVTKHFSSSSLLIVLTTHLLLLSANNKQQFVESAPRQQHQQQHYYGTLIGKLNRRAHNVSGDVYAVDEQTLFIKSFNYDGSAPDAYFWSSVSSQQPAANDGFIVPDEKGSTKPLERYLDKDVVLRLPEGKTLREINWLSVWSRQTKESLGEIMISRQLVIPRPLEISPLTQLAHGVKSGPITIVDAQTFLVPEFHYDGLGPDAFFWLTRGSQSLSASGLRLKDENGSPNPLRKYSGETVVISLPDDLTIYDFDYFGVWCRKYQMNFGQTRIPQTAKVPPSPKMLGIKPENKLNCEILYDDLGYEIRWVLDGDDIVMQLVGKIEAGEYMAFGLGKDDSKSEMSNADAVVTWVDRQSGQVHAVDYFLGNKQQCSNDLRGSCPDSKLAGGGDSLTLLHGAIVNGYSMVTFKRPQLGVDELYDQHVYSDGQQSVLWAIGTLNGNNEIGYHRLRTRSNMFIDFARNPQWNCPIPDLNASMHNTLPVSAASQIDSTLISGPGEEQQQQNSLNSQAIKPTSTMSSVTQSAPINRQLLFSEQQEPAASGSSQTELTPVQPVSNTQVANTTIRTIVSNSTSAWFIPSIVCPSERTFYAQIGPTGGQRGFEAITGHNSWGVSWYINGLMIPELVLERGQSYLFVVEGGSDKTSSTRRHPFYLTDSAEGGFDFKTDEERLKERIFAGVALRGDGQLAPTVEGRLCEWKPTNATNQNPDLYQTFAAYQRSLKLHCLPGQASVLKFTPDANTPDLIYYQCYTHRFMGWRVRIVNSCDSYVKSLDSNQRTFSNNNIKRDTTSNSAKLNEITKRPTYDRRFSLVETMKPASGEQKASFLDFGDETTASSSIINNELLTANPNDLLILNSSHLTQRQPFNLSSFEELLKLSPTDLEFTDNQAETIPLDSFIQANTFANLFPLSLPLQNFTVGSMNENQNHLNKANKTTKPPKTLHSYMRRLASIYYPVQQQLASMLASQSSLPTNQNKHNSLAQINSQPTSVNGVSSLISGNSNGHNNMQSASTEQVSSFSLSNLVPKSKIDLSKSGLTKKLNKLRFKQKDNHPQKPNQPPTPAIEFNYDIFNNQLAQLEKQQKQLQSMDQFISWPPQQHQQQQQQQASETPFNYMPMMSASTGDQKTIDLNAPHLILNNLLNQQTGNNNNNNNIVNPNHNFQSNANMQSAAEFRKQLQNGPMMSYSHNQQQQQQPFIADYLSMLFNRTNETPSQSQQAQWTNQPQNNELQQHQQQQQQQQFAPRPNYQQQPAIYITRLPLQQTYPIYVQPQPQPIQGIQDSRLVWPQVQMGASIRYPNIHPYSNYQKAPMLTTTSLRDQSEFINQMTTMPSVSQTTHDTRELNNQIPLDTEVGNGNSNGNYYDQLKPQQSVQGGHSIKASESTEQALRNQQQASETDHMLAIERFSKQPSERRPPSIVHPITGEQVKFGPNQQMELQTASSNNASSIQQPRRFSNMLIDKYLLASSEPSAPIMQTNDLLDVDQSQNQLLSSDLRRLNISDNSFRQQIVNLDSERRPPVSLAHNMTQQSSNRNQQQQQNLQAPTTELATNVLVKPSYIHYQEPLFTTTTTPSVGPLIPSLGPLTSSGSTKLGDSETVLKSTLVEPITSTLYQNPTTTTHNTNSIKTSPFLSHHHFDSGPFTPIELTNPFYYSGFPTQQQIPINLALHRLRPPSFIESMIHQHQSPFRPEPPVQVASYLTQHLSSQNPMLIASEKSVASSQPMALSMALPLQAPRSIGGSSIGGNENNNSNPKAIQTNDLIILKPTQLNKQTTQTYLLKPEYMSQFKVLGGGSSVGSSSNVLSGESEPYYSNEFGPSRRLAGHQFDRLSSLSSPPSTSMAVDPMQAAHTVTSIKQMNSSQVLPTSTIVNSSTNSSSSQNQQVRAKENSTSSLTIEVIDKIQAQHRQTHLPSKPIPLSFEPQNTSSSPEGVRLNSSVGDNTNTLFRDNNTDNAILSHVMSLISSNAIPTPPLVPVASYSSADYFLPISDRTHRSIRG